MSKYYRIQADIDLSAIRKNIETMRSRIPAEKKLLAVIKANAYGHGSIEVANALDDLADYYGVACIDEAVELRLAGITKPILILGVTDESLFPDIVKYDITQTIFTLEQAKALSEEAGRQGKEGKLHIKIDTGMNRIGFACVKESVPEIVAIRKLPNLNVEGIFTHYYKADAKDKSLAYAQLEKYTRMVKWLEEAGVTFAIRHISNSAGIMEMPNDTYDMVRSGITTYGLYPSDEVAKDVLVLEPAMQWKSIISYIKTVEPGTSISYGGTFTAKEKMTVATIPVGYADGMKRDLSGKGRVLIHGQYAPVLGRICMDQFMVDVSHIKEAAIGDTVTIFGKDGGNLIPVEEIAEKSHSFNYEFVCSITNRVPRKYLGEQ